MNLYLTGYRGSGKSTVGKILGQRINWPVIDSDDEIERIAGQTIAEIFAAEGEAGFRERESAVIADLAKQTQTVIALGGGAVLAESNRKLLAASGKTVWLKISAETSWARISNDEKSATQRPNLTQSGGIEEIEQMLALRSPIYQSCADLVVAADSQAPSEIAAAIYDHFQPLWLTSENN